MPSSRRLVTLATAPRAEDRYTTSVPGPVVSTRRVTSRTDVKRRQ